MLCKIERIFFVLDYFHIDVKDGEQEEAGCLANQYLSEEPVILS